MPKIDIEEQERAAEHGSLVKERRLDRGLNRPAFVREMAKYGQEITPDYLNKIERGTAPLARASLEVREAMRAVLGYAAEDWEELTGLYVGSLAIQGPPEGARLTAKEAGDLIRERRKAKGLTQEQLVERTGISSQSYLSAFENGRYHIGRSEHFGVVAQVLSLSEDDIRAINPSAVFATQPQPKPAREVVDVRSLPDGLREAVEVYGERFEDLADPAWQRYLAGFQWRTGQPSEAERWLDLYRDLARAGVVPDAGEG